MAAEAGVGWPRLEGRQRRRRWRGSRRAASERRACRRACAAVCLGGWYTAARAHEGAVGRGEARRRRRRCPWQTRTGCSTPQRAYAKAAEAAAVEVEQEGAAASPRPPTRLESALTVQARPHLPLEAAAGVAGVAGVAVAAAAATAPTSAAVRVATATAMSGTLLLRQRPTSHSRHHPRTRPHHRPHHRSHRPIHPPPPQQRVPHGRRWRAAPKGRRSGTRVARRGCRQPRGSRRISFAASD
eukprot:scaffold90969_cov44-Phaeocystis_antarctica.AAC.3